VGSPELEERFSAALRDLTELHDEVARFRALRHTSERAFADALRVGDMVRRAVRQGRPDRPALEDVTALEALVDRLRGAFLALRDDADLAGLERCLAAGDLEAAADRACRLFAALERATPAPPLAYSALPLRSRRRDMESLLAPEEVAERAARRIAAGLVPTAREAREVADADTRTGLPAVPEPLVLSPSLAASGGEIAIGVALQGLPILQHLESGNLWVFCPRLAGPFSIVAARQPEDEWWAASPLPYGDFLARLRTALGERSLELVVEET
jgi:hypothetical protein